VRLELYDARLCDCDARYDRDVCAEVGAGGCACELLGVVGPPFVREDRAVRGVGALMRDFLGVSVTCLLRSPSVEDDAVDFGAIPGGLDLLPDAMNG